MAIIKCKMCGGDMELSADQSFGTCEYCGSTMTLPKVDDDQRAAAFNRGNHFRRIAEFDKALAVYERIVQEDEGDAEAHWCCALCRFGIEYVKDPGSGAYVPTCHRASFDSFLEDVDYQAALSHADPIARRQYEQDGAEIAAVQRRILETVQKEAPFDVFLCYKETDENGARTVDSTLAQDIYYQLTEQGRRVFFARITLEDRAGQEYEPYIFAALHSAKVMVVVGTRPEHLNAVWVKNEWSRYLALMKQDRKRLLIPCYRDMDPYDLPEQLSVLQSYDMGKIGFIQDLIRGISKVLDADKKPATRETVVVQGEGGSNLAALLKRGNMALEDGEWQKADEFFDRVLDMDAECAEAHLGKALASRRCASIRHLVVVEKADRQPPKGTALEACPADEAWLAEACKKYVAEPFVDQDSVRGFYQEAERTYTATAPERERALAQEREALAGDKLLSRALRYADGDLAEQLKKAQADILRAYEDRLEQARKEDEAAREQAAARYARQLDEAEKKLQELYAEARKTQSEGYQKALDAQNGILSKEETQDPEQLRARADVLDAVCGMYQAIGSYKDSAQRAKDCKAEADRLRKEADAEEARRKLQARKQAEEEAEQKREADYTAACKIMAGAKTVSAFEEACAKFRRLEEFRDSAERIVQCEKRIAQLKKKKKITILIASAAVVCVIVAAYFINASQKYRAAEALLDSGDTAHAVMAFYDVGGYRDARARSMALWDEIAARDTISAGWYDAVGLRSDGTVVATNYTGDSDYYRGQCDVYDWKDIVAVSASDSHTVGLRADGTVVATNYTGKSDYYHGQCDVSGWKDIVAASAGSFHTVGLRADGTVVATKYTGDSKYNYGQCDVSGWTDIVAVSARESHTVGLKSDGTVVATGDNEDGKCDVSGWTDIVAVSAGWDHTVGLRADGTVVAVGFNGYGRCDVSGWTDIVAVSAGWAHTVGLRADGTVVAVGDNDYGQCDVSGWTDIVAVAVGPWHTVGLRADGTAVAVGRNEGIRYDVSGWSGIQVPNK